MSARCFSSALDKELIHWRKKQKAKEVYGPYLVALLITVVL
jgi:hypothetical protein